MKLASHTIFILHDPYNEKVFRTAGLRLETIPERVAMRILGYALRFKMREAKQSETELSAR